MVYVIVETSESLFNSQIQGFCVSNEDVRERGYIYCNTPAALIDLRYELVSGPTWDPKEEGFIWTFRK